MKKDKATYRRGSGTFLNFFISLCTFILIIKITIPAAAQSQDVQLANEYYQNSELDKARELYEKLSKKVENIPFIYTNYLETLLTLKQIEAAEKFVKKVIKSYPENIYYKIDHYLILAGHFEDKAQKEFEGLLNEIKKDPNLVEKSTEYFLKQNKPAAAKDVYIAARKVSGDKDAYAYGLAVCYNRLNETPLMIQEMLNYVKKEPHNVENVKNSFQNYLTDKKKFELLETSLYERIQKEPEELVFNELLLWLNIQEKNFGKAFLQAKAIDKRAKTQGTKVIEVGKIAIDNKDYNNAIRFFQYVVDEYKNGFNYPIARKLLINSKEELIKNTFPVDEIKIRSLVMDYQILIKEFGKHPTSLEAMRSMALLYAFYLDNKDTAIVLLNEAVNYGRNDERFKARVKLDLGDIYLLKGEPWESTLLYSQVEKSQKEDVLGHEAKLKNAKLNYYKGDFELAQSHLDVLKLATTREIANDAMDLSIFIQDNVGLDTSYDAMKQYAAIDLLLFQNKTQEALDGLNQMLIKFPNHSLTDEIYFLQSKIYTKIGDFTNAITALEKISNNHAQDILGDDALFQLGILYEQNLKNNEKAMELYKQFLLKYPSSIYTAEARKRFRLLRGDKL